MRFLSAALAALGLVSSLLVYDASPAAAKPPTQEPTATGAVTIDQCANGTEPPTVLPDTCEWVNGNVNQEKALYAEGDVLPYRATFTGLTVGETYFINITYDTTKSGKHALDYITTYNLSVDNADPCTPALCTYSNPAPSTTPVPEDPQVRNAIGSAKIVDGVFSMWGGTLQPVAESDYSYPKGTGFSGDKSTTIKVSFVATDDAPVLAWGGHIASRLDWAPEPAASQINGSPYHTAISGINGSSGGGGDRSLSASAVVAPATITILKSAGGSTVSFPFSTTGLTPSQFNLAQGGSQQFTNITDFGTKTITEGTVNGFELKSIACSSGTPASVDVPTRTLTLDVQDGQSYTCTFTNAGTVGTLTLIKKVNGSSRPASDFNIIVSKDNQSVLSVGGTASPGQSYPLNAGTYVVSEGQLPPGYTNSFTGCGNNGTVTVTAGANTTCTVENTAPVLSLGVTKTANKQTVPETGENVTYTVVVTNQSPVDVTISSLSDDKAGTLTGSATCGIGTKLTANGGSCSFTFDNFVSGNPGGHTNTVTVKAVDGEPTPREVVKTAQATVGITNVGPSFTVEKVGAKSTIPESPAQTVSYTVTVTNDSAAESLTITKLEDDRFPDPDTSLGDGDCDEGIVLAPKASCQFSYSLLVPAGDAGGPGYTNTVKVTGEDPEKASLTVPDSFTVNYDDVAPTVRVTKTARSSTVPENTGDFVTYDVLVENLSGEKVTLDAISDDRFPGITGDDDCHVARTVDGVAQPATELAIGGSCTMTYTGFVTPGTFGGPGFKNIVRVTVRDDEGTTGFDDGDATVNYSGVAKLKVSKTACPSSVVPGGILTYTISATNEGNAPTVGAVLTDKVPTGSDLHNPGDGTPSLDGRTVTWQLGAIPKDTTVTKTFKVFVTATSGSLHNEVTLSATGVDSATSTLDTPVSNAGALATGGAYAAQVKLVGGSLVGPLADVSTSSTGAPDVETDQLANVVLPSIVQLNLLPQFSASRVTTSARDLSVSEVAHLNLLSGLITADAVRGVSHSLAGPNTATSGTLGSTFVNLRISGKSVANVAPNTQVNVKLGTLTVARAVLMETTNTSNLGSFNTTSGSVNMLHVTLLQPLGGLGAGVEIIVGHAQSSAKYPTGAACGSTPASVGGLAYTAFAETRLFGAPLLTLQEGDARVPRHGGLDSDEVADVDLEGLAVADAGSNTASGSLSPSPKASTTAKVVDANVLDGAVTADLLQVSSTSTTNGTPATSFDFTFLNLTVGGTPITGPVAPNTVIAIPQDGSVILVILNEQIRPSANATTSGTINAVHAYVLKGSELLEVEVIVASASSEATLPA